MKKYFPYALLLVSLWFSASAFADFQVGSRTVCIVDPNQGFDPAAGINDGKRVLVTEIWYPTIDNIASSPDAIPTTYGSYFADDDDLLFRSFTHGVRQQVFWATWL